MVKEKKTKKEKVKVVKAKVKKTKDEKPKEKKVKTVKAKEKKVKDEKAEKTKEDKPKEEKVEEEKIKEEKAEESFWDTDEEPEEHIDKGADDEIEELDPETLDYVKIKDLSNGMGDVNIVAVIDFVGEVQGRGFGEEPRAIGFIKDKTGEVKVTFWGEAARLAKKGKKIRIIKGFVSEFRGQKQLNAHRKRGVEFLTGKK